MLNHLVTESPNPASENIDTLPTAGILEVMNSADAQVAAAVAKEIPRIAQAVEAIASCIEQGGRVFYIGAGTSGRLGVLDAAEIPPTFNVSPDLIRGIIAGGESALARASEASEDDPESGVNDLKKHWFTGKDFLVGIAASGRTPYVLGAVRQAREIGARTAGISCTPDSELSRAVDFPIEPVPGPEVIAGSTRLRAGTATKMVLNMISTAVMIRLGHVYRNLMVNVQPTNHKLEDRARRIIQQAAGISYEKATQFLEKAGHNVRTAIVMAKRDLGRLEAEQRLAAAGGRIREALK